MVQIDENKLRKLHEIQEMGVNPYPYTYSQTHTARQLNEKYQTLQSEEHTKDDVSVAGRIMLKRVMGKASFMHIQDQTGKVQIYLTKDDLGEEQYKILAKKTDLGDIIGIKGTIFKTKMGEVTIQAVQAEILCKSLITLPEKYHGLKDIELKYRRRYLDLIMNPETKQVFEKRSQIIKTIREYFDEKGFMEVETPTLQTQYGGANARPFITHINAWDMPMYLSISPELFLKRLLVGGFEKVFTICKNFRNEDVDPSHNPEFTMLEVYQAYVDYNEMMRILEQVCEKACIAINGSTKVKQVYRGEEVEIDFKAPWKRMTMIDSIKHYANIDVNGMSEDKIKNLIEEKKIEYEGTFSWGLGVQLLFEEFVEDKLVQPTHIIDHPKETTPLCKLSEKDPKLVERFESFCLGMEISNAYSELNNPVLQRTLLEDQANELRAGAEEAHPMDEDFVNAIEYGMPPAGGLGFGIDRLAVIMTGVDAIRDIILFPTVKPEQVEENKATKAKDTMIAVALVNKGLKLERWEEMNTIAHLNAAFGARLGKPLFMQDTIETKDNQKIKLNIQHAIMIKQAPSNKEILDLIAEARKEGLEIAEFTREMIATTDDKKVIAMTKEKNHSEIEYLGLLVYGRKSVVDKVTKKFGLYE